jgi:glutathione S-transferase
MKLYFSPGACSLAPHIALREIGAKFELEQVNNKEKKTKSGADFWEINPRGYVPVLEIDSGERITENPAILQYIGDLNPSSGIVPACGTMDRTRIQEWLNFVTSEIHKTFSPLFKDATPAEFKATSMESLAKRYAYLDKHLASHQYLHGEKFSAADIYLFVVSNWLKHFNIDMGQWPNVKAWWDRIAARPKVQEAMKAEGLIQ